MCSAFPILSFPLYHPTFPHSFFPFIDFQVIKNLRHLETLGLLLRAMEAIFANINFFIEPYVGNADD